MSGKKVDKRQPRKISVQLTDRAIQDFIAIEEHSITTCGKKVANRYMGDFESALQRLSNNPDLLREEPNLHKSLYFYRVNKHLLVCDTQPKTIFVLTVLHANMDVPERLIELEPTLSLEVEMLHQQLAQSRPRKR